MDESAVPIQSNDLPGIGLDMDEVVEQVAIEDAHQEEQAIASLSASKGWQKIAAKMQADIDGLRTGSSLSIKPDTPMEIIGQKYLVASLVAAHLDSYLSMVDSATKATVEYESRRSKLAEEA